MNGVGSFFWDVDTHINSCHCLKIAVVIREIRSDAHGHDIEMVLGIFFKINSLMGAN
jgi:hypothetical protein